MAHRSYSEIYAAVCFFPTNSHNTTHTAWPQAPSRDTFDYYSTLFAFLFTLFTPISLPSSIPGQTPKFLLFGSYPLHLVLSPSPQRPYAILSPSHQVPKVPTHQTAEQGRSIFQSSERSPFISPSLFLHLRPHTRILPGYVNTGQQKIISALRFFSSWHDHHVPRKSLQYVPFALGLCSPAMPLSHANYHTPCSTFPSIILHTAPPRSFPQPSSIATLLT